MDDKLKKNKGSNEKDKSQPKFYCEVCDCTCPDQSTFDFHKKTLSCKRKHIGKAGLQGKVKPVGMSKYKKLPVTFRCDPCDRVFSHKGNLNAHLASLKCKHKRKEAGEDVIITKNYKCPECTKEYMEKRNLIKHLEGNNCPNTKALGNQSESDEGMVLPLGKFKCVPCEMYFNTTDTLKLHQGSISCQKQTAACKLLNTNALKCSYCPEAFRNEDRLKEHLNGGKCPGSPNRVIEHDELWRGKYHCVKCNFICKWRSNYIAHKQSPSCLRNHQDVDEESYLELVDLIFPCRWCNGRFSSQLDVVSHMQTTHGKEIPKDKLATSPIPRYHHRPNIQRPFTCYVCLKRLRRAGAAYECIEVCEIRIGLSMDGFIYPILR